MAPKRRLALRPYSHLILLAGSLVMLWAGCASSLFRSVETTQITKASLGPLTVAASKGKGEYDQPKTDQVGAVVGVYSTTTNVAPRLAMGRGYMRRVHITISNPSYELQQIRVQCQDDAGQVISSELIVVEARSDYLYSGATADITGEPYGVRCSLWRPQAKGENAEKKAKTQRDAMIDHGVSLWVPGGAF